MKKIKYLLRKIFFKTINKKEGIFRVTKVLGEQISKYSKGECLDAGCGTGEYFNLMNGDRITGFDITDKYLKKIDIKKFIGKSIKLIKADIRKPPFKPRSFDFVLCAEVLECLSRKDSIMAIKKLESLCKKGGYVIISVPNKNCILTSIRELLYDNKYGRPNKTFTNIGRTFAKEELINMGYRVYGCFGYVTYWKIRFTFILNILDFFAWYIPNIGGTLVAIKKI